MKKLILLFCLLSFPCMAQTYDPIVTPQGWSFGYKGDKGWIFIPVQKCIPTTSICAANAADARKIADKKFGAKK